MYKDNSYRKIEIILGLVVLALFTSYYFIFVDIKNRNEHISTLLSDLSFQMNKEDYVLSTEKALEAINSDLLRINNSIVSTSGDVDFIEDLEAMARENGLSIEIISLVFEDDAKSKSTDITTLKIKAQTSGSWSGTYRLMREIEALPFKIKINQFSLSGAGGAKQSEDGTITTTATDWQSVFEIRVLKYR